MTKKILISLTMLLGIEDTHYLIHERTIEEWQLVSWLHRN